MTELKPHNNPRVSVIIPVYNGEDYLPATLESVISQTGKNWEIIAVNDGSADGSIKILENFAARNPGRIQVISVPNGGVSRARNTGVSVARGEYIAFLDQDDLWTPTKLEKQLEQFARDPDLGISFTNESIIDGSGNVLRENVLILTAGKNRGFVFDHLVFENFIPISSVIMQKKLFEDLGEFDTHYSLAEDYDLLLKAVKRARVDYIDESLLLYREHGNSGTHRKIDLLTKEAFEILDKWRIRDPRFFRLHFFDHFLFWLKFKILKLKILACSA